MLEVFMTKALVILCGGDSSRMGTNKALLPFQDKCLVEYIYDKFRPYFDKIYLSVNEIGDYAHLGLDAQEIPDIYRNAGPIGAILSSLTMVTEDKAFYMSVETPFLDPQIGLFLLENSDGYDITTFDFKEDFLDTVCGVYSRHCVVSVGKLLFFGNFTRNNIQSKCYTHLIDVEEIKNISNVDLLQQFYAIKDRHSYYMALFSVIKHNFF